MLGLAKTIQAMEIVGYLSVATDKDTLPTIVTPVFRWIESPDVYVFPPLQIRDECVIGGYEGCQAEFDSSVLKGEITKLDNPISPSGGGEMWVDEELKVHYGSASQVHATLCAIAYNHLADAVYALEHYDLDEAERLANIAMCAPGAPEPFAIKAAIRLMRGDYKAAQLMYRLQHPRCQPVAFEEMVQSCVWSIEKGLRR